MLEPDEVQAMLGLHRSAAQVSNEPKGRWAKGEKRHSESKGAMFPSRHASRGPLLCGWFLGRFATTHENGVRDGCYWT